MFVESAYPGPLSSHWNVADGKGNGAEVQTYSPLVYVGFLFFWSNHFSLKRKNIQFRITLWDVWHIKLLVIYHLLDIDRLCFYIGLFWCCHGFNTIHGRKLTITHQHLWHMPCTYSKAPMQFRPQKILKAFFFFIPNRLPFLFNLNLNSCLKQRPSIKSNLLQGYPTRSPQATCGPRWLWMQPNTRL